MLVAARRRSTLRTLIGLLLAFAALVMVMPNSAMAQSVVGDEYSDRFQGFVRLDGEPLEGVRLELDGNGYSAEVLTDEAGAWRIGVPEPGTYTITLDESTLPEGIAVTEGTNVQEIETARASSFRQLNFFIGEGERNITSRFDVFVALLFNGINFGLMLGLAAVGLSLVFGTTGLSNFAHAEMVTFGAVVAWALAVPAGLPIWVALPLTVLLGGALGLSMDAGLWRPLRRRGIGIVQLMIVSIGLSLAARYVFQFFIGGTTLQLPGASTQETFTLFGSVRMSWLEIASMIISLVVIGVFAWWLLRTKIGKATRAVSDNPSLAAASGIDVDRVVRIVWVVAASLAALSGILWAYFRPGLRWDMGMQLLLLIFASVTLGGLGTAFGALIGSLIVGILVEVSGLWIPTDLRYVGALVILILILLFRPQGILGRRERIG